MRWKVLLIGGSSGVGKTRVARQLAKRLSLSLLLLDDVRLALQGATSSESHPDLHVFLNYRPEQWRNTESIYSDWITVAQAMTKPLDAIVQHHVLVSDVGPVIIEGDGILPMASQWFGEPNRVCAVFIVEDDEVQLLHNLQSRGRGFNEWGELEQKAFAHASWLYGQWLAREARKLQLPVLHTRSQEALLERLLLVADAG